ncbi:MAG TPA: TRAM domain-containing protein [Elusimicrobiales bacterium]|nr:TRAM domain-containing protein [Elusimicrobiales bacterium]
MLTFILRVLALIGLAIVPSYMVLPNYYGLGLGIILGSILVILELSIVKFNIIGVLSAVSGGAVGFGFYKLLPIIFNKMQYTALNQYLDQYSVAISAAFVTLGILFGVRKASDFEYLNTELITRGKRRLKNLTVLDISAIIDGRVIDLFETNFLVGTFIVPRFIFNQIQTMANSKDSLQRARGRRGLDIMARMQESKEIFFKIVDRKFPEEKDCSTKLVKFAKILGADIITTDFEVNKAALLKQVTVLNIDDLTTALKPVVLPGEVMSIFVMKEGKSKEQGVGYLDDGTMVIVEEGRKFIGKKIDVSVYSILQTSAGRMIFVKAKNENKIHQNLSHKVKV